MASLLEQFSLTEQDFEGTAEPRGPGISVEQFQHGDRTREGTPTLGTEFERGLGQGTDSLQMSLHSVTRLLGREFGIRPLEEAGQRGVERNQAELEAEARPSVSSIAEIEDTGDFFKWAAGGLGQAIPSLATTVAGGGIGGAVIKKTLENGLRRTMSRRITRKMTQKGFTEEAAQAAARRALSSDAGRRMLLQGVTRGVDNRLLLQQAYGRGALSGAVLAGAAPITGQTDIELQEAGVEGTQSALTALLAGGAGGALEALPALRLLDRMFPGVDTEVSKAFVKDMAKGLGTQAVLEGSTEGAQEMIQMAALAFHDPTFDPFSEESQQRVIDAFAIGALVGGVTGGGASLIGEGTSRARQFTETANRRRADTPDIPEFDAARGITDPDFEPADNTFFEEVQSRIRRTTSDVLNPIVNSVRNTGQSALNQINEAFDGALNGEARRLADTIRSAHNDFVTEHRELFNRVTAYANDAARRIYQQAESLSDPVARQEFVAEQMNRVQAEVERIAQILRRNAQRQEEATARTVDDIDLSFDDDLETQDTVERDIPEANPTQFVFGKNNTGGRQSDLDLFQPPEGEVQGFSTRKAARNLLGNLRERFPSATDATFAINEQTDGTFVVELNDPANAELLMEDDRISRGVERARLSARRHRNDRRKVKLQSGTTIDFPTLVFAARDLTDVRTYNQGVEVATTRLLERGQIDANQAQELITRFRSKQNPDLPGPQTDVDRDFNALEPRAKQIINRRVNEQLNDEGLSGEERQERRQQLLAEELTELDLDPRLQRDLGREEQGDEARFMEEGQGRNLETEDEQAAASRSRRPFSKPNGRVREFEHKKNTEQKKGRVYTPGASTETQQAIQSTLDFVTSKLGLKATIRVVNKQGALNMITRGHAHASLAQRMQGAGAGRLVRATIDGVDYAYVLLDTDTQPHIQATVLLHELGHQVYHETWSALSSEGKRALRAEFVKATKGETNSRVRGRDKFIPDEAEFNEWMADQMVAYANSQPEADNPVQQFIAKVGAKLRDLFNFLMKNQRFADLNMTYNQFIEGVANRARGIETDSWFKGEAQPEGFRLPEIDVDNIDITIPKVIPKNALDQALEKYESRYPAIVKRATLIRNWIVNAYSVAAAPSNSTMMQIGKRIPQARKLVQIFGREAHGQAKRSQNYHQRINLMKGQFTNRYRKIIEGMDDAEKAKVLAELRKGDGKEGATFSPKAQELRALFDDMHRYLKDDAGIPIGKITNYFPRIFSRELLIENKDKIVRHLVDTRRFDRRGAESFYNSLISDGAESAAALRELDDDPLATQAPSFRNMRSREAQDRFFDEFLDNNMDNVVANYVNAAVKRGEFNRFLGMDSKTKSGWKARGKYDALLKNAELEGATPEDLKFMKRFVDANLGMLGRDFDRALPGVRTTMAAMMAYQNMRVLMFTVFASLPDLVGPAIRSGDMRGAFNTLRDELKNLGSKGAWNELARTYGIVSDQMTDHIFTEYVDNHYMPPQFRKWNDAFFKYTGLQSYTNFTRRMALAVGRDYIKNQARIAREGPTEKSRDKALAALKELALTPDRVDEWVANGEPTWDGAVAENRTNQAVAEALVQFVDESIMRPNAAQRPLLASHPGAMMVYHLKGYMYALYEVVIRRMAHNFNRADTPAQAAAAVAPAILMMALTAIGLELRELVQYGLSDREPPSDRQDGWEYTWNLVERTGLLGPSQLVFDFSGADKVGMTGVAAVGGPTLGQFAEVLSRPPSQTVPKSLPIVGQLPWARDGLREVTPL